VVTSIGIALLLALAVSGCSDGPRIVGAQREFEEQADAARENARERRAAHRRAFRVESAMQATLRAARRPTPGCRIEYGPLRSRQGIVPIACGDIGAAWPLTVAHGYLRCEPSVRENFERVIFTAPDGTEYAVSRAAAGVGYADIGPILKPGAKDGNAALEPLLERGLAVC
jgi:hypothetical protein